MQKITVQGKRFIDEQGRERVFRGVNLKAEKKESLLLLDDDFFRRSAVLGQNMLRLGVCWEHFEPEPGQYDEQVLGRIDAIFDRAARHGMYVLLDVHQDLWSAFEDCTGNGAPAWACRTDGIRRGPTKRVWAEGYFWDKAVHRCFDHFWANTPVHGKGLQEHYAALWQMLARRYADHPAFFGFDLFNEPHPGTPGGKVFRALVAKLAQVIAASPSIKRLEFLKRTLNEKKYGFMLDVLTPEVMEKITSAAKTLLRQWETEQYAPFLARMAKAIREVTPKGIIVVEQCYYCNLGIPSNTPLPPGETQLCYTPHGYDFMVDTPAYRHANNARVGWMFGQMRETQKNLRLPVIVSEWGGGGEGESFFPHINYLADLFDSYNWSNIYFTYGEALYGSPIMQILSRPCPVAVNGTLEKFKVRPSAKTFTLWYTPSPAPFAQPTEIYIPDGYESVDAGKGAKVSMAGNILQVVTDSPKIVVKYK